MVYDIFLTKNLNFWPKGAGKLFRKSPYLGLCSGDMKNYETNLRIRAGGRRGLGEEFRPPWGPRAF